MNPYRSPDDAAPNPVTPTTIPAEVQDEAASPPPDAIEAARRALQQRGTGGANWFFWIAGLSLVNSVILISGSDTHFVIGLGVTLMADVIAKVMSEKNADLATLITAAAFGFDLVVALVVVLFGWLARQRYQVVYGLGMFLYLLDGLLYVLFQDWMSVGFHAFALFCMWSGFSSFGQLNALEREAARRPFAAAQAPAEPQGL